MRSLLTNFRNFAFSGSSSTSRSDSQSVRLSGPCVADVILPLVAALFGEPNFDALKLTLNGAQIKYGEFLTALVSFLLLAITIMLIVPTVRRATGREAAGAQGNRERDHGKSFIPVDASVCMFCTRDVAPIVD